MRQKAVTTQQIRDLDRIAIEKYGIPSLVLMENAGRAVAQEVFRLVGKAKKTRVCVVCGLGNNAGDGFVVARHLMDAGIRTKTFLIGRGSQLKTDAAVNYRILKKLRYSIKELSKVDSSFLRDLKNAGVVVDALFGVGLNREVEEPFLSVIEAVNQSGKKTVSVDTPSGIDGTTGKIYGACVKADVTVTFSFIKKGFLKGSGPEYAGKVVVADIGIPRRIVNSKWQIVNSK